jgi:hypothetical protein
MIRLVQEAYTNTSNKLDLSILNFMDGVVADQALSMINYHVTASDSSEAKSGDFAIITSAKLYVGVWFKFADEYHWNYSVVCRHRVCIGQGCYCGSGSCRTAGMTPKPVGKQILAALEHAPEERIEERTARFSI